MLKRMVTGAHTTLLMAKEWLLTNVSEGAKCPCCGQNAKVYRRKLHATIAKALIQLHHAGGSEDYQHTPSLPGDTHEISQASWWGLIEEENYSVRPDGGRAGFWKLTEEGNRFVLGVGAIPEYAFVYNGNVVELQGLGVTIHDCLGTKFDYLELINS
jgi:hypothetical protein